MREVAFKTKIHFKWFLKLMIYWFFFLSAIPLLFSNLYQFLAPTSSFFVYEQWQGVALVDWNYVWWTLTLESRSYFKQDIYMKWYDTLYCNNIKYPTQLWEDYMIAWDEIDSSKWKYFSYIFTEADIWKECKMKGNIVWETSKGYKKTLPYETDSFIIREYE